MGDPVTGADKHVFGANATYHDITGLPLETGIGALPHDRQAELHCVVIEQREGKTAGDAMRAKLAAAKNPPARVVPAKTETVFEPAPLPPKWPSMKPSDPIKEE